MGDVRWRKTVGRAEITKVSVGPMDNNVYVLIVGGNVVSVDAGSNEADFVLGQIGDRGLDAILQTHNHGDHIIDLEEVVERTGAKVYAHPDDELPVAAEAVGDAAVVSGAGDLEISVLHTPGHTRGSVCYLLTEAGESHLFAGDTLFPGGPGNTFGRKGAFATIMRSLDEKLFVLPDETHVYPGHGADTTIGAERPHLEEWRERGW